MKQKWVGKHTARTFSRKRNQQAYAQSTISLVRPLLVVILLVIFGLTFVLSSGTIPEASASLQTKGGEEISDSAARQIQSLLEEKESRTPAQQKIDSQLIYATKTYRGQGVAIGVSTLETNVVIDGEGKTIVDMTVNDLKRAHIVAYGGQSTRQLTQAMPRSSLRQETFGARSPTGIR